MRREPCSPAVGQIALLLAALLIQAGAAAGTQPFYTDPSQPVEKRVDDLVARMTLDEKISQLMNGAPAIDRLGIPAYDWWNECLHGVGRAGLATVFPQATGMAATWDTELIGTIGDAISTEARAKHHEAARQGNRSIYYGLTFWSPNINLYRDPRWGRGQETYGEDPFLTGRLGVAFIKGLQGSNLQYLKVVATPKHFAVHSGPEALRHEFDATPPERDLYDSYLPQFEAAISEAGAVSIMGAYNRLYGEPCCGSLLLLDEILRKQWGFQGYVVSDCWAIDDFFKYHKVVATPEEAAALAIKAGCDLECGDAYSYAAGAVKEGLLSEAEIDTCLKRLMAARVRLGMFDPPEMVPWAHIPMSQVDCPEHQALALKAARESIVLLKNDGVLPLKKTIKRILVMGPNADSVPMLLGNYNGTPSHPVTILQGIRDKAGPDCEVTYFRGCDYSSSDKLVPVPAECLRSGGRPGLKGEYFENKELAGEPKLIRQDKNISFNWNVDSPAPGMPRENFSVRWTGEIISPVSGKYEIGVRSDDGCRLGINGVVIAENWTDHAISTVSGNVYLEAGKPVSIVLEYYQGAIDAEVYLLWSTGGPLKIGDPDVIVFAGGICPDMENEGLDRTRIELPDVQSQLLRALHGSGRPVILVNCSGGAVAVPWEAANLPAIVQAWYPGQAGGTAVADVLFGDYNPSGRLSVTFYQSTDDLPPFTDYAMAHRTYRYFTGKPLWPFGHGLSYTRFDYSNILIDKPSAGEADTVVVSCDVKNAGAMDGDEVVQLYISEMCSSEPRPLESLKGYARVSIRSGETVRVNIPLKVADLRCWDVARKAYVVYPGVYQARLGASSADIRLSARLDVE